MAHSSIKPIWKYSWKPEGHGVEDVILDTSSTSLGSIINLEHSFFRGKEFSASVGASSLTVGFETQNLTGKEDIVLRLYDAKLSQLGDSPIFRAIEIASKRAKAKELALKVNFIADAIDPEEFGQVLNQEADVTHKSLEATESITTPHILVNLADIETLKGSWGSITADKVTLTADSLALARAFYEKGKVILEDPLTMEVGGTSERGMVRYNPDSFLWEIWNARSKKFVPIIISHNSAEEIPAGSVPIVAGEDPAAQSYVDWLRVDPATKTLQVPQIETEKVKTSGEVVELLADLTLQGHTFRAVADGILDIDNLLQLDTKTGTVRICGLAFDAKFMNTLKKLESRLNSVEKKLEKDNQ